MTAEPVQDVLCLAIPQNIDPTRYVGHPEEGVERAFLEHLSRMAHETVWDQWKNPWRKRIPTRVDFERVEWLITTDIADVERFQPAHDCADCWMGNLRAEEFLKKNPGRWIAMANITYTPVWGRTDG